MSDSTTLKAKVIDVRFVDDVYEDDRYVAWEEIECETMSEGKIQKIVIINNVHDIKYTIKKNQVLLITIKGIDSISETGYVLTGDKILDLKILKSSEN